MKMLISSGFVLFLLGLLTSTSMAANTIADWTFEVSVPSTAGPFQAELGTGLGLGSHISPNVVYSTPVGNGSNHSFSSNNWSVGDYYQFQVATTGLSNIGFQFDQASSNQGPRDFRVDYSTDGSTFSTFATYSVLPNITPAWNGTNNNANFSYSYDLSAVTALNNQSAVYFRLINNSLASEIANTNVATAGTDRIDNIVVLSGVPEPSSILLAAMGLVSLLLVVAVRRFS
jgi:hypothetical protein